MMRSSNPALRDDTFTGYGYSRSDAMTVQGVVFKTLISLLLVMLTAGFTWIKYYQSGGNPNSVAIYTMIGVFGGLAVSLATVFKKEWAPVTTPIYALLEGLFIGGISAIMNSSYPGIVIQAAGLTFGTLFIMLLAYQSGMIAATERFKLGVVAATGAITLVYFASILLNWFGIQVPLIYSNGWVGIAFSFFVVGIAALNLILDFDFIEQGARQGAPKYMEWFGAFAMMVTLIWLYIEFLRLLSKLRSR